MHLPCVGKAEVGKKVVEEEVSEMGEEDQVEEKVVPIVVAIKMWMDEISFDTKFQSRTPAHARAAVDISYFYRALRACNDGLLFFDGMDACDKLFGAL